MALSQRFSGLGEEQELALLPANGELLQHLVHREWEINFANRRRRLWFLHLTAVYALAYANHSLARIPHRVLVQCVRTHLQSLELPNAQPRTGEECKQDAMANLDRRVAQNGLQEFFRHGRLVLFLHGWRVYEIHIPISWIN